MFDLHCHSTHSDGILNPQQLVTKALENQLRVFSLTDHDSISGYSEFNQASANTSLSIIKGIELSTRWKKHDLHILGYNFSEGEVLDKLLDHQEERRIERALKIAQCLESIGVKAAYEKASIISGHQRVARPHFAQLLVEEGKSKSLQSAFKQFLVRGRLAYVPTEWISMQDAVATIKSLGGDAVIAHPLKYGLTRSKMHELINEFKDAGGEGIEVISGLMNLTEIKEVVAMSLRFELFASTGSDFHGGARSRIDLGRQFSLPQDCVPIWEKWNIKQR